MSKSGHPKFLGLTLTQNGGMLGAWEDGSVARWEPTHYREDTRVEGYWYPLPSPDYEALFCTTTSVFTSEPDLTLSPDVGVDD